MKSKVLVQWGYECWGRMDRPWINQLCIFTGRKIYSILGVIGQTEASRSRGGTHPSFCTRDISSGFCILSRAFSLREASTNRKEWGDLHTWDGAPSGGGSLSLDTAATKQPAVSRALTWRVTGGPEMPTPVPPAWVALWYVHCSLRSPEIEINYYIGNKDVISISNKHESRQEACGGTQQCLSSVALTRFIFDVHKEAAGKIIFWETFALQTFPYLEKVVLQKALLLPPWESPVSEGCILLRRFWLHRHRHWAWVVWRDVCEYSKMLACFFFFSRTFPQDVLIHSWHPTYQMATLFYCADALTKVLSL